MVVERGRVENGGGQGERGEEGDDRFEPPLETVRDAPRGGSRGGFGRSRGVGRSRRWPREGARGGSIRDAFCGAAEPRSGGGLGPGATIGSRARGRTGTLLAVAERGVEDADVVLVVDPARDVLRPGRADDVRVRGRLRGARHRAAATRREAGPRRPGGARDRASRPERGRRDRARRARHRGPGSTGWDESTDARRRHEGRARVWRPRARRDETRSRSPAGARRSGRRASSSDLENKRSASFDDRRSKRAMTQESTG